MGKLLFYIALWAAKLSRTALRTLGRNATNFPGRVALKICPKFLQYVGKPNLIVAVTGTNGKTTVCNLALDILEKSGQQVMNNRYGSNTAAGIASVFVQWSTSKGEPTCSMALLEVDERSSRLIYPYIKPQIILVTNLFRDSIKRNAHAEYIAGILTSSIPAESLLILNADDLISCGVAPDNKRLYFGIDRTSFDRKDCVNRINDMQLCPRCHSRLHFDYRRYHHIGRAHCENCPFESPGYDYMAHSIDLTNMEMSVTIPGGEYFKYKMLSDSIFNIYNELAVIALLRELGAEPEDIAAAMRLAKITESRYNSVSGGGVNVVMQMAKDMNALACSRAFDYVGGLPGKKEIILMMYNVGGYRGIPENVTWLYDCDFEFLNRKNISRLVAVGPCADDYYLRLLMAGIPEDKLRCVKNSDAAIPLLSYEPGESIYVFYGTDILDDVFSLRDNLLKKAKEVNPNAPDPEPVETFVKISEHVSGESKVAYHTLNADSLSKLEPPTESDSITETIPASEENAQSKSENTIPNTPGESAEVLIPDFIETPKPLPDIPSEAASNFAAKASSILEAAAASPESNTPVITEPEEVTQDEN